MADATGHQHAVAPNMAALGQEFRAASDAKLRKVTRLIDRMPDRGAADALLAPVRDRLAALRPVRNMNRNRLLFTPFDQILVRPARWQPGSVCLPRSVLAPVIALLDGQDSTLLPVVPPFDAADPAELVRCGRPLWAAAATAIATATIPPDWCNADWELANGLSGATLQELLPVMAMVLRSAHAIRTLPPASGPSLEQAVLVLLTEATRSGPIGWGIMLALLLEVAPADLVTRSAGVIARGDRLATLLRNGVDLAVTHMLGRLEQLPHLPNEMASTDEPSLLLERLGVMQRVAGLRDMENRPGFEQKRIARIEQSLDVANRAMFQRSLLSQRERFETAMSGQAGTTAEAGDKADTMLAIEADARRLRTFALSAAALEGGRTYQAMIDDLITGLAGTAAGPSRPSAAGSSQAPFPVARLRLVELLAGSERAVQLAVSMRTAPAPAAMS